MTDEALVPERISLGLGVRVARRMDTGGILLRRWFGAWIDFVVLAALAFAPVLLPIDNNLRSVLRSLLLLAYFPVTEGVWGRSVGKFATGTIVIDAAGNRPAVWRIVVRTLLRIVEVNPFALGGIPAGIMVMCTKNRQRLGDLAAGTYVVQVRALGDESRRAPVAVAAAFD